ncbi:MAG: hypothetical protein RLY57_229 [Candidatus Parcubacteria bacterium]|jgi:molecular chaperone DnaJ
MAKKDYYESLGINKNASKDEIKKAFRKAAQEHHPDKQGGNAEKFKELNEAYSVLSDDQKRAQYDQFGRAGANMGGGGFGGQGGFGGFNWSDMAGGTQGGEGFEFDLGDIFGDMFGGGGRRSRSQKGADITVDLKLTFAEAIFGATKSITITKNSACSHCKGTGGEPGTRQTTCKTCSGKGSVKEIRRTILGQMATTKTCETCHGKGTIPEKSCSTCHGKGIERKTETIEVKVPASIEDGEMLRVTGRGEAMSGGASGDLYIRLHVAAHSHFKKVENNIEMDLNLKLSEALLGATKTIDTLDGTLDVKIPAGIQFGEVLRVKYKTIFIYLHVKINLPKKLSKDEHKLVEELKEKGL